jgi:hypothetical protein
MLTNPVSRTGLNQLNNTGGGPARGYEGMVTYGLNKPYIESANLLGIYRPNCIRNEETIAQKSRQTCTEPIVFLERIPAAGSLTVSHVTPGLNDTRILTPKIIMSNPVYLYLHTKMDSNMDVLSLIGVLSTKSPGTSAYGSIECSRNSHTNTSTISRDKSRLCLGPTWNYIV